MSAQLRTSPVDVEVLKALADPVRLTLIGRLASAGRPLTVSEASTCCGTHLSGVSRHLATLRRAGLVTAEPRGREVLYRLEARAIARTLRDAAALLESTADPADRPRSVTLHR